jgi:hypothetical protein
MLPKLGIGRRHEVNRQTPQQTRARRSVNPVRQVTQHRWRRHEHDMAEQINREIVVDALRQLAREPDVLRGPGTVKTANRMKAIIRAWADKPGMPVIGQDEINAGDIHWLFL